MISIGLAQWAMQGYGHICSPIINYKLSFRRNGRYRSSNSAVGSAGISIQWAGRSGQKYLNVAEITAPSQYDLKLHYTRWLTARRQRLTLYSELRAMGEEWYPV